MTDEVERHVPNIVGAASGSTIGSAITALCSMAGVAFHDPAFGIVAVPVGAVSGAVTQEAVGVLAVLWQQRRDRIERFVREAESRTGTRMGKLLQEAAGDPRTLEMLARCVEAAARSLDEEKIDLLARIFVSGERDTAKVDEASILVEAVRQLEAPHLRLLSILAEPGPHLAPGRTPEDQSEPNTDLPQVHTWRVEDILAEDPGLSNNFDALIARLYALGFVYDEGNGRLDYKPLWYLTRLGRACVQYFEKRGARTSTTGNYAGR